MSECKHAKWGPVQVVDAAYPFPVFRDECLECGCIMVPDFDNPVDGIIPMKAKPMAKVLDFMEFKARREQKKLGVANG